MVWILWIIKLKISATISYVPQDNFLFSDKIKNNINFKTSSKYGRVIEVAKLSDVHENIISLLMAMILFLVNVVTVWWTKTKFDC